MQQVAPSHAFQFDLAISVCDLLLLTARSRYGEAMINRIPTAIALAACAVMITACSSSVTQIPRGAGLPSIAVASVDNSFEPQTVSVVVGQSVTWTNTGRNLHDVKVKKVPTDFGIDQDSFIPLTGTYTYAFSKSGSFVYYCSIHGTAKGKGMAGTIVVSK
jgi:plastocyanin